MNKWLVAGAFALLASTAMCAAEFTPPKAGKGRDFSSQRHQARLDGHRLDRVPRYRSRARSHRIVGVWKNGSGPRQDVILAKMGGKAKITNVAAGMSGSPRYIDGKLVGAVALRMSVFSPDAVCGITPIELMLEIPEFRSVSPHWMRASPITALQRCN